MNDVGLLAAMYMNGIQVKILNGETNINFGSVYENFVCQELFAHGFSPAYYNSRKHGEIDFVIDCDARVLPIEVKSGKHYARHRALDGVLKDSSYEIDGAIVFDDDKFQTVGKILYAPIYMAMFIEPRALPSELIYDVGAPLEFGRSK